MKEKLRKTGKGRLRRHREKAECLVCQYLPGFPYSTFPPGKETLRLNSPVLPRKLQLVHSMAHKGNEPQAMSKELVVEAGGVVLYLHKVDGYGWHIAHHRTAEGVCDARIRVAEQEFPAWGPLLSRCENSTLGGIKPAASQALYSKRTASFQPANLAVPDGSS